ncbi:CRISPR-associated endonuclease Cas2 [Legionella sp. km535]|uniref:CRISPR-associated endonuclease Cas2 n=1 Tax=Legionella sp. km535 TaxID=2498107 RepID=UPI0013155A6B|nr:CRISPR-associated endonuclease Cas2 [Legionella sp. km535]
MQIRLYKEYIISYDIGDNSIRRTIFEKLKDIGLTPIQKSVFWGYLNEPEIRFIANFLKKELNEPDSAFITPCTLAKESEVNLINLKLDELRKPDGHIII